MNTWKAILATLVIFVAGVVTGGLLVNYTDRAQPKTRRIPQRENAARPVANPNALPAPNPQSQRPANLPVRVPHALNLDFLQHLDSEVHLTPEQRQHIEKIIREGQERQGELWKRIAPDMREELARTRERIRDALKPEQRERFEELMKQNRPAARRPDQSAQPNTRPRPPLPPRDAPAPDAPQTAPQSTPPGNP